MRTARFVSISRLVVILFGTLFAVFGLGFWFAPEQAAQAFNLEAIGVDGLVALRAELGGLFAGLAAVCLAGAISKRRSLLTAAALVLGAIVTGRIVGLIAGGDARAQLVSLAIEAVAITAVIEYSRSLRTTHDAPARAHVTRRIAVVIGALTVVAGVAALLDPRVELKIFQRGAAQNMARDNSRLLSDNALRVAICGSSAPLPSGTRAKACAAVFAAGKIYLVDTGPESVENLVLWGVPLARIGGVLLTHFHSDHIGDLGELQLQSWAGGRPSRLRVFGGPGVERVVNGFNEAYRLDQGYRTTHHTPRIMPPETWGMEAQLIMLEGPATPELSRTGLVLDEDGLRITAIEVNHRPIEPAYAYRFDFKGRSVVVTGDLKYHPPLAQAARGADILVIEGISRPMVKALQDGATAVERDRQAAIMHDIQDYHIDPAEASDIANRAGVKLLAFYHLLPTPDNFLARRLFANDVRRVRQGDWTIADDGSLYTLPAGSSDVRIGRVER
jgi:ribonuclease Z